MKTKNVNLNLNSQDIDVQLTIPEKGDVGKLRYKLIDSMKQMSKPLKQMVTELIDNALDAGATKVKVTLSKKVSEKYVDEVIVADNGRGMNYDTLLNSFTMGVDREALEEEQGKFRLGGTLYCLDHFRNKETVTLAEGEVPLKRFSDLDVIETRDEWVTFPAPVSEQDISLLGEFLDEGETGTVIKLSNPGVRKTSKGHAKSSIISLCGVKYHNYIVTKGVEIEIDGKQVEPQCPILSTTTGVDVTEHEIKLDGKTICTVHCANLRSLSKCDEGNFQSTAGIYAMRNGAVLSEKPFWFGEAGLPAVMTSKRQNDSRGRYLIKFTDEVDDLMGISNGKDGLSMTQSVADKIAPIIKAAATEIRRLAQQSQSASSKKVQQAAANVAKEFAKKTNVKPKVKAISKSQEQSRPKQTGRRNVSSGNYAGLPKKKNPWLTEVEADAFGYQAPLTFRRGETLCINTELPFYTKILKQSSQDTLEAFYTQAVCYHSAFSEALESIDAEQDEEKRAFARKILDELNHQFDFKMRQV